MDKQAKRNEQELVRLNLYEKELIKKHFEKNSYRSKQAMLRDILISYLENNQRFGAKI